MKLTIIRGPAGTGKTTFARSKMSCMIVESDMFFIQDGQYLFDPEKHARSKVWRSSVVCLCVSNNMDVCVTGQFIKLDEVNQLIQEAKSAVGSNNLEIEVIDKLTYFKSEHGVPIEKIKDAFLNFEEWGADISAPNWMIPGRSTLVTTDGRLFVEKLWSEKLLEYLRSISKRDVQPEDELSVYFEDPEESVGVTEEYFSESMFEQIDLFKYEFPKTVSELMAMVDLEQYFVNTMHDDSSHS